MSDQNIYNMTVVWNAGGTTFAAVKMNVTDTASAAASLLLQFQVGGSDKFKVGKDGTITGAGNLSIAGNATITGNLTVSGTLSAAGITGTVTGPAGATDNAIARFNGTSGGVLQNSGVTIDDSGNMTIGGVLNVSGAIVNTGILSHPTSGTMVIRPNGSGSATGQLVLSTTGALTVAADVTAAQDFKSSTNTAILNTTGAGSVYLRPNGVGNATGQVQLLSTGAVTINGTLTVTG